MFLRRWTDKMKQILYPSRCACCSRVLPTGQRLCADCAGDLPRIEAPVCRRCGQAVSACLCGRLPRPLYFDGLCAPFCYTGVVRDGVWQFKFRGRVDGAAFFGEEMAKAFQRAFPLSKKRRRQRGYDQAELLAGVVAGALGRPLLHSLIKTRNNKVQHVLPYADRQANVQNIYACGEDLSGQTVLLVDDIKTTGATLNACARELKEAGAEKVICLTASIVPPKGKH